MGTKENCFLLKILSRKPSFLKKIWLIDMMSLYSVVVTRLLIHIWSFYSHWWYSPCFICLEILINFVGNWQNCFLLKILSRKLSFLQKIWLIDMSLYSVVVTQLLVHIWSFYSHWRYSPCFICLEILINFVGRKKLFFYWISFTFLYG